MIQLSQKRLSRPIWDKTPPFRPTRSFLTFDQTQYPLELDFPVSSLEVERISIEEPWVKVNFNFGAGIITNGSRLFEELLALDLQNIVGLKSAKICFHRFDQPDFRRLVVELQAKACKLGPGAVIALNQILNHPVLVVKQSMGRRLTSDLLTGANQMARANSIRIGIKLMIDLLFLPPSEALLDLPSKIAYSSIKPSIGFLPDFQASILREPKPIELQDQRLPFVASMFSDLNEVRLGLKNPASQSEKFSSAKGLVDSFASIGVTLDNISVFNVLIGVVLALDGLVLAGSSYIRTLAHSIRKIIGESDRNIKITNQVGQIVVLLSGLYVEYNSLIDYAHDLTFGDFKVQLDDEVARETRGIQFEAALKAMSDVEFERKLEEVFQIKLT